MIDFSFSSDYDIELTALKDFDTVTDIDEIGHALQIILLTATNEWFLNTAFGTEWFEILGKKYDEDTLNLVITQALSQDTRVQKVGTISSSFDRSTRKLTVTVDVTVVNADSTVSTIQIEVNI